MTTINQITTILKDIANRNYFINDFGIGPIQDRELQFPYLWVTVGTSRIQGTSNNILSSVLYTFTLYVMDRNSKGNDEIGQEIISDSHGILCGIIADFEGHPRYRDLKIQIQDNITFTPGVNLTDNDVSGHYADITFKVPFTLCVKDLPMKNNEIDG